MEDWTQQFISTNDESRLIFWLCLLSSHLQKVWTQRENSFNKKTKLPTRVTENFRLQIIFRILLAEADQIFVHVMFLITMCVWDLGSVLKSFEEKEK